MITQFLAWYVVVQLIGLLALPLAWRLLAFLPDRGYASARALGILLVGYGLWIAYSFGLLRYEVGSAWFVVFVLGGVSLYAGWPVLQTWRQGGESPVRWRYVLVTELVFLLAFAAWALVRAYDPAANHTEKPMDLMFMNSIVSSPTYPPLDAWLGGYPISYYYFGYWLLTTLGLLSGQPPAVAYNLGQACWYGLLLSGAFGVGYNLLAAFGRRFNGAVLSGLLSALLVGMAANLQAILEWLYANGAPVGWLGGLLQSRNFPAEASVTHNWYIDFSWWWWRSSRALADVDLAGNHIEVIDEFPAFSYILGDNHPHVLAMPFATLVISLALNLFLASEWVNGRRHVANVTYVGWRRFLNLSPLGWAGWLVTAIAAGSLLALNTWDFPAYWLLLVLAVFAAGLRGQASKEGGVWAAVVGTAVVGAGLAGAALLLYLPYFLTAQSQAGGIVPNLFNPTRVGQFVSMFATALLALLALLLLAWRATPPRRGQVLTSVLLAYGLPTLSLLASVFVVTNTDAGRELLARMPLPEGSASYLAVIAQRWGGQLWTFVLVGGLLSLFAALIWAQLESSSEDSSDDIEPAPLSPLLFVLFLAAIGLLLVYAPEFVFLRDNFGTRMNTVFKFYYQAWLLFGLAAAFTISVAVGQRRNWRGWGLAPALLGSLALLLGVTSSIYLFAGAYSKTMGFSGQPTFDATAWIAAGGENELAAAAWVRENTQPGDLIVEGKGASYRADLSRISTLTGRQTLLGWDSHETQWRGEAYAEMADGRAAALEAIYRGGAAEQLQQLIDRWGIDYVYVGPAERAQYGATPAVETQLRQVMDLVFESGDVRIYRAR
jgi:YYY domain-containing protein